MDEIKIPVEFWRQLSKQEAMDLLIGNGTGVGTLNEHLRAKLAAIIGRPVPPNLQIVIDSNELMEAFPPPKK